MKSDCEKISYPVQKGKVAISSPALTLLKSAIYLRVRDKLALAYKRRLERIVI